MRVLLVTIMFMSLCSMGLADTLRMEKNLEGENLPGNHIWARKKLKSGEVCAPWEHVCKTPEAGGKQECKSCVVTYLIGEERAKRKLTWDSKKLRWLGSDGKPYDTAKENAKYGVKARTRYEVEARKRWGIAPGIWVLDTKGQFYSSVEQSPGKFHHSSFLGGGLVEGAGQVVFVDGQITRINNASGHYKPDVPSFEEALKHLHLPPGAEKEGSGIVEYDGHSSAFASPTNVRHKNRSHNKEENEEDDSSVDYKSNLDYYDNASGYGPSQDAD